MRKFFVIVSALILITLPSFARAADTDVSPSIVLGLVNAERAKAGLPAFTYNPLLAQAAEAKAEDLAAKGYFEHTSPEGRQFVTWIDDTGYKYSVASENLAESSNAVSMSLIMSSWMNSPTHKANILGNYKETGVGIAYGTYRGMPAVFIAEEFASPQVYIQAPVVEVSEVTVPVAHVETKLAKAVVTKISKSVKVEVKAASKERVSTTTSATVVSTPKEEVTTVTTSAKVLKVHTSFMRRFLSAVSSIFASIKGAVFA